MIVILLLVGLAFGSFLNVLIWRLNDEKAPKFWQGRSVCPKCKRELLWRDNIPLLSFILLRRKCRFCHKKISWRYPLVEFMTALATVGVWYFSGSVSPIILLFYSLIVYVFTVIFFSDWIYGFIPDEMIVIGTVLVLIIYRLSFNILRENLLVGILSGLAFLLIVAATRFRGMGLGDVKLAFLIGFLLGFPKAVVAFWLAFVLGGMVAIALLLLKKVRFSDKMAFGPYLVLGTLFSALWSSTILSWVIP